MEDGKGKAATRPDVIRVARRGPVLRPSPCCPGVKGAHSHTATRMLNTRHCGATKVVHRTEDHASIPTSW